MIGWRGILTLVLLAAAIVSGWSVWRHSAPADTRGPSSGRADYTLIDFELISLDRQGRESFILRAPHLARAPGDRTLQMETPLFLFPDRDAPDRDAPDRDAPDRDDGGYWRMRSRQGWVSAEGDEVRLTGDVRATGPETAGTPSTLRTEQLNVFPETERVTSAERVAMSNGASIIQSGTGLRMNLDSKQYALLSDVEFRYDPSR